LRNWWWSDGGQGGGVCGGRRWVTRGRAEREEREGGRERGRELKRKGQVTCERYLKSEMDFVLSQG